MLEVYVPHLFCLVVKLGFISVDTLIFGKTIIDL